MERSVDAVFRSGVFRPVRKVRLADGKRVRLSWREAGGDGSSRILELAAEVYKGLTPREVAEVEKTALDRRGFSRGRVKQ